MAKRIDDPHTLPDEPAWLTRLANAQGTHSMSDFSAHEIARYVRTLREASWPIIRELEKAGDDTNWTDGDETDRVYPWYEIEPLKKAVLGDPQIRVAEELKNEKCSACGGRGSIEDEDGVWICPCHKKAVAEPIEFKFDERSLIRCPKCKSPLNVVKQEGNRYLNSEQFDSVKAGDFYCSTCPGNDRGKSGLCYWWKSELGIHV